MEEMIAATRLAARRRLVMKAAAATAISLVAAQAQAQPRRRTYVLIHGAWYGGWVWRPVADGLRGMGHTVHAPSLTGLGDRRHLLRPGINLDTHADDIVNLIQMEDLDQVVLVGWSYGGMVASDVLGRIPEKIASIVYLDAFAPDRGRSMLSHVSRSGSVEAGTQLAIQGRDLPPLPTRALGVTDEALATRMDAKLGPHPIMTMLQDSKAPAEWPAIPRTYVLAGAYAEIAPTFRPFYERFRTDPRATAHVLPTSHVMMQTDVAGTLNLLANVA